MNYVDWNDGTFLYHHGIKGMRWGIRRFVNRVRSNRLKRKQAIKTVGKYVKIGAIAAGAAIASYGTYTLVKDLHTQKELNKKIKLGKASVDRELSYARSLIKSGAKTNTNSVTINYYGNDSKLHQGRINYNKTNDGRVTGYSYYNMNEDLQDKATLRNVRDNRKRSK